MSSLFTLKSYPDYAQSFPTSEPPTLARIPPIHAKIIREDKTEQATDKRRPRPQVFALRSAVVFQFAERRILGGPGLSGNFLLVCAGVDGVRSVGIGIITPRRSWVDGVCSICIGILALRQPWVDGVCAVGIGIGTLRRPWIDGVRFIGIIALGGPWIDGVGFVRVAALRPSRIDGIGIVSILASLKGSSCNVSWGCRTTHWGSSTP